GGKNDSDVDIAGRSIAISGHGHDAGASRHAATPDATPIHQTQGSESGGLFGSSNQSTVSEDGGPGSAPGLHAPGSTQSGGRSTLEATIHEDMLAIGDSTAVQEQHGPTVCCSSQFGNPTQDHQKIREFVNLFTSNGTPVQTD